MSHDVQNEIAQLMCHNILRSIISRVKLESVYFAVIADETTDTSGVQQLCITLRWVDANLQSHEDFVGLHEVSDASAKGTTDVILDVLLRFGLDVRNLRGQGYDGCSVMAGRDNGVAARIRQQEKRAVFVHCSAHSMNLAVQEAAASTPMIRDCLSLVHDLVLFFRNSPTRTRVLQGVPSGECGITTLKPLCPTRWSVRAVSVSSVLRNYSVIMEALEEIAATKHDDSATRARGFLRTLERFETLLALRQAQLIFGIIDDSNVALQCPSLTLSSAKSIGDATEKQLTGKRSDDKFHELFSTAVTDAERLDIGQPQLPRNRRVSSRLDESRSAAAQFNSAEEYYRKQYYEFLDSAISSVNRRFSQPGMDLACKMESVLLGAATGKEPDVDDITSVVDFYGDLDQERLMRQLEILPVSFCINISST